MPDGRSSHPLLALTRSGAYGNAVPTTKAWSGCHYHAGMLKPVSAESGSGAIISPGLATALSVRV